MREQPTFVMGPRENSFDDPALEGLLLAHGGHRVVCTGLRPVFRRHTPAFWYGADRFEPGAPNCALLNVAVRYAQQPDIHIGVGYALDDDGIWQEHAWGLAGPYVIETTHSRRIYWGVRLTGLEARNFCFEVGVTCEAPRRRA